MWKRRFWGALAVLPPIAACGGGEGAGWAGTVTDSAGIAVVRNPSEGLWAEGEAWTLVEELAIGAMDADAAYQFGLIIGVDVDAEGNVYVADLQARDVRVFDPAGAWLRTIGRPGSGPGELGPAMNGVFVIGGEVVVPDLSNARVQRFSREGDPVASEPLELSRGVPLRWDLTSGGRLVVQRRAVNVSDTTAPPAGDPIVTLPLDGGAVDTLAVLPVGESVQFAGGQARIRFFDPEPIWDADAQGALLTARNNAMRFEVRDSDGSLRRVITFPHEPKPVTDRDEQILRDAIADAARRQGAAPQAVQAFVQQAQFADNYPAFVSLAVGPEGSVWVQRMRSGDELVGEEGAFDVQDLGSAEWDVFDAEGRYLGVVTFPGKFQPIRSMGDRFYGVARDELDVQSLKVYRVVTG
ncbi:MAG TPA: hypothetical protein VK849_03420 [Longimicrobiales bacterium]|nr:hypothetical protein [Longimicrobiales bacterium]